MGGDAISAFAMRQRLVRQGVSPTDFRKALLSVAVVDRDRWVDEVFGIDALVPDGPDLPRGCVPYVPCAVDVLLSTVEQAAIGADDVFVDVGCGVGRAALVVQLLTGASAVGVEVQAHLACAARDLAARLARPRLSIVHGDAVEQAASLSAGTVFFLYCPFSDDRLKRWLGALGESSVSPALRVCCVDLPLRPVPVWLEQVGFESGPLAVYRRR